MLNDLRYALRMLMKSPGFTVVAVLTLAIGIGATAAIFEVMHAHLLDPIPGQDEARLVEINEITTQTARRSGVSPFLAHQLMQRRETFEVVTTLSTSEYMQVSDGDFFTHVIGTAVDPEFFTFFNVQPVLGRWLTPEERRSNAQDLIVISHAWWQARFGGDSGVVGRQIKARGRSNQDATYTIIGVMPPHFQFPAGDRQYWRPLRFNARDLAQPGAPNYTTFARLAPGVSREGAQALLDTLRATMIRDFPSRVYNPAAHITRLRPMREFFIAPEVRNTLWSVAVAAGIVLLIVCGNLANLQLARSGSRQREMAVRSALGAGRMRLLRHLLTESVALSLMGGAGGLLVAYWLQHLATPLLPPFAPALRASGIGVATLAWTFGVSALCGLAFGLFPAWRAADHHLGMALKDAAHGSTGGSGQRWFAHTLVVSQIALAVVLLSGAGLLVRSIVRLLDVDLGLDPKGIVEVYPGIPLSTYRTPEASLTVTRELAARFAALPGTIGVGIETGGGGVDYFLQDNPTPISIQIRDVGTGSMDYFKALGLRLKEGRWFNAEDEPPGMRSVIVNESLAATCWPGQSAIGQRIYSVGPEEQDKQGPLIYSEVVGVVRDFKTWSLEALPQLMMFAPSMRRTQAAYVYYVRTSLDPASLAGAVRQISKEVIIGPSQPTVNWVEQELYASTGTRRLLTWLLASLAGVGTFLAMLGVFGVLLHTVVRRTREIGVRLALGAQRRDIVAMVMRRGMLLVCVGAAMGLGGTLALASVLRSLLYGVTAHDPLTIALVLMLLLGAAILACWLPARRASRVDPMVALRAE